MSGPFTGYSPPGVYTETKLDPAVAGLLGNLRVPAIMGTSDEVKILDSYDLIRGSSSTVDNKKVNEDVSSQFNGTTRECIVANFPIVDGKGNGTITNNPNDVVVKVQGEQVIVAKVIGLEGKIILAIAPAASSTVLVTYNFKRTDTKVIDEALTDQIDGTTTTFYTHFAPIVDGTNAGKTTTNVSNIIVKINNSIVNAINLDGVNGAFTLSAPPTIGETLTATYYWNKWPNTSEDLPQPGLTRVIRVGLSPETSDFIETIDFAIIDNTIEWGTGTKFVINKHTVGSEFFDDTQMIASLEDDRIWNEDVSSQFTGIETEFTTKFVPIVDGTGRDTVTEDPTTVMVTVNGSPAVIRRIDGETGKVVLMVAPPVSAKVMVTYWRSRMEDDTYEIEIVAAGPTGVGTYKITSLEDGRLGIAIPGAESVASPSFTGAVYTTGPTVTKGYTVDETVTLTFTSNTQFVVTSSNVQGSSGFGETDSTYIDSRTGLIFTLQADPFYAAADSIQIDVTKAATFVTSVIPITSVPGVNLKVDNTNNCAAGDITNLFTFDKSGKEPGISEHYYITYEYIKTDFDCKLFTKFKDITSEYGPLNANNPIVLASYIAFLNGAVALITCQAKKAANAETASDQEYFDILERLKQPVDGTNPAVILPLTTSGAVINAISAHCNTQSSKRYRRERICFFGFATGTEPNEAGDFAAAIKTARMTCVYPDGATIELTNADGTSSEYVVDGSYLAVALCGVNVSLAYDVAEPMTRKTITGFKKIVRTLDEVTMDNVATKGVTIIEQISSTFRIRHGLTTDMTSTLTREINVVTVADFMQQEARRVLDQYIGKKFTNTVTGDVSATLGAMMKAAVDANIIVDYKGVSAERDSVEPDFIRATAYYQPMVGVNYIEVVFNVRVKF